MKRYHYRSDTSHMQPKGRNAWIIPAGLGAGMLGLVAIASVGGASSSEKGDDEVPVVEPLTLSAPLSGQPLEPPTSDPSHALGHFSEVFELCVGSNRYTCVVDGDTLWIQDVKVRVADIDTPEVFQPQCDFEKQLGDQATNRFIELLNAGPFELHQVGDRDEDRNGRKLRVVVRDGRSLGDQLVSEGLARTWTGRREPWC